MDPALRHGHGLVLFQRRAGPVLQLIKAMNAKTVDSVGIGTQKILHMVNIKKFSLAGAKSHANRVQMKRTPSRYPGHQLDARQIVARQYVLLTKASSDKLQAPSRKRQACDKLSLRRYVTLTQDIAATLCHIDTRCSGVRHGVL